ELSTVGKYTFRFDAIGTHELRKSVSLDAFRMKDDEPQTNTSITTTTTQNKQHSTISLHLADANINDVLAILAAKAGLNIVSNTELRRKVKLSLNDVHVMDAIDLVLGSQQLAYSIDKHTLLIGKDTFNSTPTHLDTAVIRINNAHPKDLAKTLAAYLTNPEHVQHQDNLLIIHADRTKLKTIKDIVATIDNTILPQVIIETHFLEIERSELAQISTYSYDHSTEKDYITPLLTDTLIRLEENQQAITLSKPRINIIHGETATIFIGDTIPYNHVKVNETGKVSQATAFIQSGIKLSLVPEINLKNQLVKINIQPEVSFIDGFLGKQPNIPVVKTRTFSTTAFVKHGQTVLIDGLFNTLDERYIQPTFLNSLPLLGQFFMPKKQPKTEVVVAITARIIKDQLQPATAIPVLSSENQLKNK
ncbi:hypothetical protein DID76_01425, partial [Candidatus Marinamargulisbacteria bacterium SCGC AG-414-C22]